MWPSNMPHSFQIHCISSVFTHKNDLESRRTIWGSETTLVSTSVPTLEGSHKMTKPNLELPVWVSKQLHPHQKDPPFSCLQPAPLIVRPIRMVTFWFVSRRLNPNIHMILVTATALILDIPAQLSRWTLPTHLKLPSMVEVCEPRYTIPVALAIPIPKNA